ncbi:MAG: hypothetical protein JWN94_1102, partial [Betaproteobacteria bacterium]|nr:hypothetical protein [Betaproteobacteria bacterium]
GQIIPVGQLTNVTFVPDANTFGTNYANFTFTVQDPFGALDPVPNRISFNVDPAPFVPPPAPPGLPPSFSGPPLPGPGDNAPPEGRTGFELAGGWGSGQDFFARDRTIRLPPFGDTQIDLNVFSIETADGVKSIGPDGKVLQSTTFGWPAERQAVPGATRELRIGAPIGNQRFRLGSEFIFELPRGSFIHTDPDNIVNLIATQPDGRPLPGWLAFDDISGIFSGTPPANATSIDVLVVARDQEGHESQQTFRMNFVVRTDAHLTPDRAVLIANDAATSEDVNNNYAGRVAMKPGAIRFAEQLKTARPQHGEALTRILGSATAQRSTVRGAT